MTRATAFVPLVVLAGCSATPQLRLAARIDGDFTSTSLPKRIEAIAGPPVTTFELRRARLDARGDVPGGTSYRVMLDFASGRTEFKNAWLEQRLAEGAALRAGYMTEPFGLERRTSTRHVTFLERSLADTLMPGRNAGAMLHGTLPEFDTTLAAGVFKDATPQGLAVGTAGVHFTARATVAPWRNAAGDVVHVGTGYSHRRFEGNVVRIRARPEAHSVSHLVDTGNIAAIQADLLGIEVAIVLGRWSVQAEAVHARHDLDGGGVADLTSGYVQGSVFLTGERRAYRSATATFGRVVPRAARGAWEVAVRLSHLDLDDGRVLGGRLTDATLGVNWYADRNMRIMWNLTAARLAGADTAVIAQLRLQVDL